MSITHALELAWVAAAVLWAMILGLLSLPLLVRVRALEQELERVRAAHLADMAALSDTVSRKMDATYADLRTHADPQRAWLAHPHVHRWEQGVEYTSRPIDAVARDAAGAPYTRGVSATHAFWVDVTDAYVAKGGAVGGAA